MEQSLRTSHGPGSPSPSGDRLRKAIERNRAKRAKKNPKPSNQAVLTPPPPRENLNRNTGVESNRKAPVGRVPQRRTPPRRSSAPVHAPAVQKRPDHLRDTLEELENFDDFDVYDEEDEFDEEGFEEVPNEEPYHQVSRQAPPRAQRSPRSARPMSPPPRPPKRERTPPPPPRKSTSSQENLRREKQPRELPKGNGLGARKKEALRSPRTNHLSSHKKPFKFPGFIQRRIDGIRSFLGPREKWLRFIKKLSWLVCFILLARLVLSDRGVLDYFSQKKNYEKKIQKLSFLHDHKLDLKKKIKLIKNNKFHQKKLVRDHLGFISKDEFLILFQKGK